MEESAPEDITEGTEENETHGYQQYEQDKQQNMQESSKENTTGMTGDNETCLHQQYVKVEIML